jgi:cytidine diphosphoramidate kinase
MEYLLLIYYALTFVDLNMDTNCFWITGLSSAGKTTLSQMLVDNLRSKGKTVILLDGDELREILSNKGYSRDERLQTALKYSRLCSLIVKQKVNVVIGVIGLFNDVHQWNRQHIPGYIEIFVDVPLEELIKRDPKKLYEKAMAGQIKNVYGVDLSADFPKNPDVHLVWSSKKSIENMMEELLNKILKNNEMR